MEIQLRTLTPLWTGGVDQTADRLHETGLLGSLRWWYEALVRGLGGHACDPTEHGCTFDEEKYRRSKASDERQRLHDAGLCDACQLFGATGWARKFRPQVVNGRGELVKDALLQSDTDFVLRFLELRAMNDAERWLLSKAVWVAASYGALGGKTTLKPQKDQRKGADNGVVRWIKVDRQVARPNIGNHFRQSSFRGGSVKLPDLRWFFFTKGAFLRRDQINPLLGLDPRGKPLPNADDIQRFLRGKRGSRNEDAVSKKIFSFRADEGRIWGYAQDAKMRDKIILRIKTALGQGSYTVKTGEEVLNEL